MSKFTTTLSKILKEESSSSIQTLPAKVIEELGKQWKILNMDTRGVNILEKKTTEARLVPATPDETDEQKTETMASRIPKGSFIFTGDDTSALSSRSFTNKKIPDIIIETLPNSWQFLESERVYNINPEIVIISYKEMMIDNIFSVVPIDNIFASHDEFIKKTNSAGDKIPERGSVKDQKGAESFQIFAKTNIWDKSPAGSRNFGKYCYIVLKEGANSDFYNSLKNGTIVPLLYAGSGKKYKDKEGIYDPRSIFFISKESAEKLANEAYDDSSPCLIMIRGKDTSWLKSKVPTSLLSVSVDISTTDSTTKQSPTPEPIAKKPTESNVVNKQPISTTTEPSPEADVKSESLKREIYNMIKENIKINIIDEDEAEKVDDVKAEQPANKEQPATITTAPSKGHQLNYTLIGPVFINNIEFRALLENCKKAKIKTFTGKTGEILYDDIGKPIALQSLGYFSGVNDPKLTSHATDPSGAIKAVGQSVKDIYKKISN